MPATANSSRDEQAPQQIISTSVVSAVLSDNLNKNNNSLSWPGKDVIRAEFNLNIRRLLQTGLKSPDVVSRHIKCVYWNEQLMRWSRKGCHSAQFERITNDEFLYRQVCYCDHLSLFALLFDPQPDPDLNSTGIVPYHHLADMAIYIGVSISSICFVVLVALWCHRPRPKDANTQIITTLFTLISVCFLLSNLLLISLTSQIISQWFSCRKFASIYNFFLFVAFEIALFTAYHQIKVMKNSSPQKPIYLVFALISSVGFGLIFSAFDFISRDNVSCSIPTPHVFYFLIAPILILTLSSLLIYLYILFKIMHSKSAVSFSFNLKRVVLLLASSFLFAGISWLLGIFLVQINNSQLKLACEILFGIASSIQAASLLLAYLLASGTGLSPSSPPLPNKTNTCLLPPVSPGHQYAHVIRPPDIELTVGVKFFIAWYRVKSWVSKAFGLRGSGPQQKPFYIDPSIMEFAVVNYEIPSTSDEAEQSPDVLDVSTNQRDLLDFNKRIINHFNTVK